MEQIAAFKQGNCDIPLALESPEFIYKLLMPILMSVVTSIAARPLGIPSMVSHILAGLIAGRFGHHGGIPGGLKRALDVYAIIGLVFQLFLIGVQINLAMVPKAGRRAIFVGIISVLVPLVLVNGTAGFILSVAVGPDNYKPFVITSLIESMGSFPVIACFLTELNMVNLEFCHIAFSSSMVSGILSFGIVGATLLYLSSDGSGFVMRTIYGHIIVVLLGIVLLRPLIRWMIKHGSDGRTMTERYMYAVFTILIGYCLACSTLGISSMFGALFFGILIPPGPPLGSSLVERLEFLNTWTIMPIFYAIHGFEAEFSTVSFRSVIVMESLVILACIGKFVGGFFPALYYYSMSFKDATLLGLSLNAQGFVELSLLKVLMEKGLITRELFTIMYVTIVVITGSLVPIATYLYRSSMNFKHHNIRTVQQLEPHTELRIIACLSNEDNVPSIMQFLKATNPTKDSPININVLHLVELVGRATPAVISHVQEKKPSPVTAASQRIINVFKQYEERSKRGISVLPYTVVSTYAAMDESVYMLSLQKMAHFIVLPYHKNLATGVVNSGIRTVNCNVLEKAPCSVGILIDRGLLGGIKVVLGEWPSHHVAMLFLGGADDREALAVAERMSTHPVVELTVFRFLMKSDTGFNCASEDALDDEMISDFQCRTAYNDRVTYVEEWVSNPVGLIKLFESIQDKYQFIILGRRHDESSPLIMGLTDWEKCTELGTLGDIFTSSGYAGNSTIMVVQQQLQPEQTSYDLFMEDVEPQR